jgi:hypothetical protein
MIPLYRIEATADQAYRLVFANTDGYDKTTAGVTVYLDTEYHVHCIELQSSLHGFIRWTSAKGIVQARHWDSEPSGRNKAYFQSFLGSRTIDHRDAKRMMQYLLSQLANRDVATYLERVLTSPDATTTYDWHALIEDTRSPSENSGFFARLVSFFSKSPDR